MEVIEVADLAAHLGRYLRHVRAGGSILVRERGRLIARIDPAGESDGAADEDAERLDELEARGLIRRGRGRVTAAILARRPRVRADAVRAVLAERAESL